MLSMIKKSGFTLMDLMISLSIMGILTLLAAGSYSGQIKKERRIDGINAINAIALAQERYRTTHTTYGTLAEVGGSSTSNGGYYTLTVPANSATGYTITATATGTQTSDTQNGTSCTPLQLVSNSGTLTKTPLVCWPQ